jgi:hypothetical protein
MSNPFLNALKKIGAVITWPIRHSVMLGKMLVDFERDEPKVKDVIIGLVEKFEALGPQAALAIAARGLNIPADLAVEQGVKNLFAYFTETFLPTVEEAYSDFEAARQIGADAASVTGAVVERAIADPAPAVSELRAGDPVPVITAPALAAE